MSEERIKILEMLSKGKITIEEADKLLRAIHPTGAESPGPSSSSKHPKYLRVLVEPTTESSKGERVDIRVPMKLIRAGLKLATLIPKQAQPAINEALKEKGIEMDFSQITPDDLEELVVNLNDLTVDVKGKDTVRIFCE